MTPTPLDALMARWEATAANALSKPYANTLRACIGELAPIAVVVNGDIIAADIERKNLAAELATLAAEQRAREEAAETAEAGLRDMISDVGTLADTIADANRELLSLRAKLAAAESARDAALARVGELERALAKLADHMDRAGGDRDGMPECPWCKSGPDGDDHGGDCELVAARAALSAAPVQASQRVVLRPAVPEPIDGHEVDDSIAPSLPVQATKDAPCVVFVGSRDVTYAAGGDRHESRCVNCGRLSENHVARTTREEG